MRLDGQFHLEARGHRISLDRSGSRAHACFVSHAHSDHISALKNPDNRVIASPETLALAGFGSKPVESLDGLKLSLLPSGHMLGSSQLRVECDGKAFTYTGDFKLGKSLTCKEAEVQETDELMIEGTFGDPSYSFPEREEAYAQIAEFASRRYNEGHIVILGGYSLGKAQELVAVVNKYCGLKPITQGKIARACKIYSEFGFPLSFAEIGAPEAEELMRSNFVAVLPFHQVNFELAVKLSKQYKRSVYTAVATGWAGRMRLPVDKAFPLSDHADFKNILEYVERARPKRIHCCHGNEERLSHELQKRGWAASPAAEAMQTRVSSW